MSRVFFALFDIFYFEVMQARERLHRKEEDMPANNRPQIFTEFIRMRIKPEHMIMLQTLADTKGTTISKECRTAIEQYLQNVDKVAMPIVVERYLK